MRKISNYIRARGILAAAAACILLTGCAGGETSDQPEGDSQAADTTEQADTAGQEETDTQETDAQETDAQETEGESTEAEGSPSKILPDLTDSEVYQVGDTISFSENGTVLYNLTINDISYTEGRDEYTQDPGNVFVVTYTYENLSDETLLIDDMRFQLMTADQETLFDSYYFGQLVTAEPVENGESYMAQIAYSSEEHPADVTLVYQDTVHTELTPVMIEVTGLP